jgi:hypothetical protein
MGSNNHAVMDAMTTQPPPDDLEQGQCALLRVSPHSWDTVNPHPQWTPEIQEAIRTLNSAGLIEWGRVGAPDEFWVVRLADVNAPGALMGYARMADNTDPELASEVRSLLSRAGANSPFCSAQHDPAGADYRLMLAPNH